MKTACRRAISAATISAVTLCSALLPTLNHAAVAIPPELATPAPSARSADMTEGEVRKVDRDSQKITLKHAEIKNLDMPGMTMLFQVRDPAFLDAVKPGDKVKFAAERVNGAIVVTQIQVVR